MMRGLHDDSISHDQRDDTTHDRQRHYASIHIKRIWDYAAPHVVAGVRDQRNIMRFCANANVSSVCVCVSAYAYIHIAQCGECYDSATPIAHPHSDWRKNVIIVM